MFTERTLRQNLIGSLLKLDFHEIISSVYQKADSLLHRSHANTSRTVSREALRAGKKLASADRMTVLAVGGAIPPPTITWARLHPLNICQTILPIIPLNAQSFTFHFVCELYRWISQPKRAQNVLMLF